MIYVVTHTTKHGKIGFCSGRHASHRHTTKYSAEATLKHAIEGDFHTRLGRKDFTMREFKNMAEAYQWAKDNSATGA